jgi:hypothetical protein
VRPVAASHAAIHATPQRILIQCLGKVFKTLKKHHAEEYRLTNVRKFWIVENSLESVLTRPDVIDSMFSSDIDSMYQNMDQDTVILSVSIELERAAQIVHADDFAVVIYDTIYGNADDEVK